MSRVILADVKEALLDSRFRKTLPENMNEDIAKFLQNPNCPSCIVPILRKVLRNCKPELRQYFPNKKVEDEETIVADLAKNNWTVINCKIDELERKLKKLPPGRKQIEMARYKNEITVIVNNLEIIF